MTIPDWIDPKRNAVLDAEHRSFVNYETFFFADDADKRRFDADPSAACGVLTDPVTKKRFKPGSDSPHREFDGRTYFFLDASSKELFDKSPEAYARPNYDMIQMPGMK